MPLHFKTKEGYQKWEAYKHIHGIEGADKGKIFIHGHLHKVRHKTGI